MREEGGRLESGHENRWETMVAVASSSHAFVDCESTCAKLRTDRLFRLIK